MNVARFMATVAGRLLRVMIGVIIIWIGVVSPKPFGYVLEFVGLIPIVAAAVNWCFICPLFGGPMKASDLDGPVQR